MPETDFPCCETKAATKAPEWYRDRVRQAINEYETHMAQAANYENLAARHAGDSIAEDLAQYADEARQRAHDAVLEAAEAVKQEPHRQGRCLMTNSDARKRAQAAASQVQGVAEAGADEVERLTDIILTAFESAEYKRAPMYYAKTYARAIIAAGWVPPERVAEARADALRRFADSRGVNVGDEDDRWWSGYRQAQRECIHDAIEAARIAERGDS